MEQDKNTFTYTYSAAQQAEVKNIRKKYLPQEESKLEQLRRLDRSATKKGTAIALAVGILGCLVLGAGMSCCMVWDLLVPGSILGLVGLTGISAAYPLFVRITRRQREKLAPEILRLTDELLK